MKKILFVAIATVGLVSVANASERITINNMNYIYHNSEKKCKPTDYKIKKYLMTEITNDKAIVEPLYKTIAGDMLIAITYIDNNEYVFNTFTTYGICRLYEDITNGKKNLDMKNYVGLS